MRRHCLLSLTFVAFITAFAQAQIPVTDDAFTSSAAPNANYGVSLGLVVQSPTAAGVMASPAELGGSTANTYLKFDLSALPPNVATGNVSKANLRLYVDFVVSPGTFDIYQAAGSWNESTLTASTAPGIVGPPINQSPISVTKALKYIDIDITSAFANGSPANGLVLVPSKGSGIFASFDSKENPLTSHDPELSVSVNDASNTQLQQEIQRATQAENTISTNLATEVMRAEGAESSIKQNLSTEVGRAETAEGMLQGNINTVQNDLSNYAQLAKQNTFLTSQTIAGDLSLNGNLNLQGSTGFNSAVINMNGTPFIHAYGPFGVFNGNTSVGSGAGSLTTSGVNNTAVGFQALTNDSSGTFNTAVGTYALSLDSTGSDNTAVGRAALGANTTGFENMSIGLHSLYRNTSGSSNTAAGNYALFFNTTGTGNTALGWEAGSIGFAGNTTGSNNTFIGYFAGSGGFTDLSNATAIGANAEVFESNALVLGGTGGNAVNVGIGTSTPHSPLDVVGNAKVAGNLNITGTVTGNGSGLNHVTADSAKMADNANTAGFATNAGTANNATTANTATFATSAGSAATAATATSFTGNLLGDVTGSQAMTTVSALQGVPVSNNVPQDGQVLGYSSSAKQWQPVTATASGGGGGPSSNSVLPAFLPGPLTTAYTAADFVPDSGITITHITAALKTVADPNCPPVVLRVSDGSSGQDLNLIAGQSFKDSGPMSLKFAGGANLKVAVQKPANCPHANPADANVLVQYRGQQSNDPETCAESGTVCNGICEETQTDPNNCGACGNGCVQAANTANPCSGGKCSATLSCSPGFADCDNNAGNGCEINITSDTNNCGACGNACPRFPPNASNAVCTAGVCKVGGCIQYFADCDGNAANGCETDVRTSGQNCGGCGNACPSAPNADPACKFTAGFLGDSYTCGITCKTGYGDCDGNASNGCEANLQTDPNNCGTCGNKCAGACSNGACLGCASSQTLCNGVCVNTASDPNNCGSCGKVCPQIQGCCETAFNAPTDCGICGIGGVTCYSCSVGQQSCVNSTCGGQCPSGQTLCGSTCTNTSTDNNNCGACGNVCAGGINGLVCTNGQCLTPSGGQCNTNTQCASGICQQDGTCQ